MWTRRDEIEFRTLMERRAAALEPLRAVVRVIPHGAQDDLVDSLIRHAHALRDALTPFFDDEVVIHLSEDEK